MTSVGAWLANSHLTQRDADILIYEVTGLSRSRVLTHPETELSATHLAHLNHLKDLLAQGTPLAYVLGEWEFWGLTFDLTAATLIPRPDTELLVGTALEQVPRHARVLELGTGSGAIAVALATARPDLLLTATDLSTDALQVAQKNALRHDVDVTFIASDWFENIHGRWQAIIANPPYVAANDPHLLKLGHEPRTALVSGQDGLDALRHIVKHAGDHLCPPNLLLVEHGYDQGDAVRNLFVSHGFSEVATRRDLGENERVTLGRHLT